MVSTSDSDYCLILDFVSKSIFSHEVLGVHLGLIVEVVDDGNYISDIEHFDVVFVRCYDDTNVSFGGLDQVILLQTEQIFNYDCLTKIDFKIVLVDLDRVLVFCPYFRVRTFYFEDYTCFAFLCS